MWPRWDMRISGVGVMTQRKNGHLNTPGGSVGGKAGVVILRGSVGGTKNIVFSL